MGFLKMDCWVYVCILADDWVCVCCFCVWLTRKICCWVCVCILADVWVCFCVWLTRKIYDQVCVCVLAGNQFVFLFLCLVDKKGQENARKSGHVFFCLNLGSCSLEFLLKMNTYLNSYIFWILIFGFLFYFVKIDKLIFFFKCQVDVALLLFY